MAADNSIAIGSDSAVYNGADNAVALGVNSSVSGGAVNSVALGYYSVADEENTVSVGGGTDPDTGETIYRRITNLAGGTADDNAATVGQLNGALGIFGNEAAVSAEDGSVTRKDFTYRDDAGLGTVQSVFDAIDEDVDANEAKITAIGEVLGGESSGYRTPRFTQVTIGDDGGSFTVKKNGGGLDMGGAALSNLAAGAIAENSAEAVTGGQLYSLGESVSKALGGSSKFENGTVTAGIEVGGQTYDSVQEALDAVNTGVENVAGNAVQYDGGGKTSVTLNKGGDAVKLTNVADGALAAGSTDAVTGGQLYAVKTEIGGDIASINADITSINNDITSINADVAAIGGRVTATEGDIKNINNNISTINNNIAGIDENVTNIIDGIATGDIDVVTGKSLAVKYDDDGKNSITLNGGGSATAVTNVADGKLEAGSTDAVTGGQLFATNERVAAAETDIAGIKAGVADVGNNVAELTGEYDALNESAVKYDGGDKTKVTLNDGGAATTITNVKDGTLAAGSTDAVTGGQLYTTNEEIEVIRDAIATGDFDIFTKDSLAVKYDDTDKASVTLGDPAAATARAADEGVELKNIADGTDDLDAVNKRQLDAVQGQVDVHKTTLEKHETTLNEHTVMIENHEEQFTTLQTVLGDTYSSPSFSSITVGNIYSDGTNINMGGGTITGLADGSIAPGSTDAVTGGQLWNAYKRMDDLNESINIVGAHAAALSGLHPIQYNPYEPTTLSAAIGTYRDEYAVAVGVFHYVRSNVLFNLGASICSDGDVMGRAGVSLAVGKGGKKKPELARDMVGMQQQMIAMQAMLEELKEENAKNKETIKKNEETIKELKEALGKKK